MYTLLSRGQDMFKNPDTVKRDILHLSYTANNYCHCTAICGVTFPTVVWQYSVLLMAVISTADDSNRNSLMSSAALSTAKLLSET